MNYTIKREDQNLVVELSGEVDMNGTDALRRDVDHALELNHTVNLVFDLAGVTFIDSAGLGVILGRYKKVTASGGRVCLAGAGPMVKRVLELSGLLTLMEEYPSVEEFLGRTS